MSPSFSLRPVRADDAAFLLALYASSRREELDAWGWPELQRAAFLELQHRAQRAGHLAAHPLAVEQLVLVGDTPVGRWFVDRSAERLRLVDVALLPEWRGRGIGGALLAALCDEADRSGLPIELSVSADSPARRLYARHGLTVRSEQPPYLAMRRDPRETSTL